MKMVRTYILSAPTCLLLLPADAQFLGLSRQGRDVLAHFLEDTQAPCREEWSLLLTPAYVTVQEGAQYLGLFAGDWPFPTLFLFRLP